MAGFDLDAIIDDLEPFEFTFGGERFLMSADPDLKFFEYLQKGSFQQALWEVLGADQYEMLDGLPEKFTVKRAKALFQAYTDHIGDGDVGKSSASSGTARTAKEASKRSKRTSTGSTK